MIKNVLMLVHTFPPMGSVGGSIRIVKFLKYINEIENNIKVSILTLRNDLVLLNDPHLSKASLSEVPENFEYIRTNTLQPRHPSGTKRNLSATSKSNNEGKKKSLKSRILTRVYKFIEKYILIPDYGVLWYPYSIRAAIKEINKKSIKVLYATAPPFSVIVQAAIIKKITKVKLVIDIKDDWIYQQKFLAKSWFVRAIEKKLEKFSIDNANKIILVTPSSLEDFNRRYPHYKDKFELISNGCDVIEYEKYWDITYQRNSKFTIIHSGVLVNSRNPSGFFDALVKLKKEGLISKSNFEMKFIGPLPNDVLHSISDKNLDDIICTTDYLEREEYIKTIISADLLLAFNYQIKTLIPGKLYDYWGSRRPILLIDSPDSMAAKLVNENNLGIVKDFLDVNGQKEAIKYYFNLWNENCLDKKTSIENLYKYDRKVLTRKLIDIIEKL